MTKITSESFENTEKAFIAKSDWQLKKAYWLFKIVNNNTMARLSTRSANLALKMHLPVKGMIKNTVFEHFCGGESIEESQETVEMLNKYGIGAILDYSVEGKHDEAAFDNALKETMRTIENAKGNKKIPYCVFKPTGMGSAELMEKIQLGKELNDEEKAAFGRVRERYYKLGQAAYDNNIRLLIDAEDSWYQNTIDNLLYEMMEKFNKERAIIFNTYQMYRWASLQNIKDAHARGKEKGFVLGAKLVRGAYMEIERERAKEKGYEDPICADKHATDKSYNDGLKYCIENIGEIELFNGSHNEYSNLYLTELMKKHGLANDDHRIYFSQLYGMSDNISYVLGGEGYNVAKYVPYGPIKHVMPYLIRRAEENTSVAGQSSRELNLLHKEILRRKTVKG
ncbi:MAG: proline dehydrogenase family protein [Cyclobacteriaceae bacterium]|nr:proline dehydrogenase family protein [Cyclobacteriaceae bacterium]